MPYNQTKIYGPYTRKDKRQHVILLLPSGKSKTVSYPKFLMEQYLGRLLKSDETVDHVDGDFTNNNLDNLQVLSRKEHCKLDAKRNKEQWFLCGVCGKKFPLSGKRLSDAYQNRKNSNKKGPFCSRRCAGKASHDIKKYSCSAIVRNLVTEKSLI